MDVGNMRILETTIDIDIDSNDEAPKCSYNIVKI